MSKRYRAARDTSSPSSSSTSGQRASRVEAIRRDKDVYDELMHRIESESLSVPLSLIHI